MDRRRKRRLVAAGVLTALGLTAAISAVMLGPSSSQTAPAVGEGPTALSQHFERLRALPGNQGMAEEGPGGAADNAFFNRAFPADTISVANMESSRQAFTATTQPALPRGQGPARRLDVYRPEQGALSVRGAP